MIITICGSIKAIEEMEKIQDQLEKLGHTILTPTETEGVDYWGEDNTSRVEAKKKFDFISGHMSKIEKSDAILIVNMTKNNIENYIGANTFLEIGFAHYRKKKIYLLNPVPDQKYILDEIQTIEPIVLNGVLTKIS